MKPDEHDPVAAPALPSLRRRLLAMVRPTRVSELLTAFGAQKSPTSVTQMRRRSAAAARGGARTGGARASDATVSSAVSSAPPSPASSVSAGAPSESSYTSLMDSREDSPEKSDAESVIRVAPRGSTSKREQPGRATRKPVNYSVKRPKRDAAASSVAPRRPGMRERPPRSTRQPINYSVKKPKRNAAASSGARKMTDVLTSDTAIATTLPVASERDQIRKAVLHHTKPKRDAFVWVHKDYFERLLPRRNYVDKLMSQFTGAAAPVVVPYMALEKQPQHVQAAMKPYQLEGLSFLVYMYRNGMPAILGDEMGLGKTLQTLALFQYLAENEPTTGEARPHLVVCPLSVLSSWAAEARKWVPHLHVVRFHGHKSERERLKKELSLPHGSSKRGRHSGGVGGGRTPVDILVTSYETFTAEQVWLKRAFAWRYCVLDEGHKIKNEKSEISSALQSLQAEYRVLLTGTPLQNDLKEMWALLHWLLPDVFPENTQGRFKEAFDLTHGKVSTSFVDDARRLLELIMLRRMKSSPGVNLGLPSKEEVLLYVPLTPMQRFWYTRLLTKADNTLLQELFGNVREKERTAMRLEAGADRETTDQMPSGAVATAESLLDAETSDAWAESKSIMEQSLKADDGKETSEWKKLMHIMMQLRKACNHPYLLPHAGPEPYYIGEHVKTASGKFIVLDKIIEELVVTQKKKVLIFSGFTSTLDLCEDLLTLRGADAPNGEFRYVRFDGGTSRARRNLGIRMFNDMQSDYRVMLISTRAGGLGVNLASASDIIMLDEDWNPQVMLQAEARAHRIGQTQPVTVYKICTQGTVEEQMQGRIRKKLYLSAKITESMRNIHSADMPTSKKRKLESAQERTLNDDPQLGTSQLKSLLRKGAQTLARPEVDVTAMLNWSFAEIIERCKDRTDDPDTAAAADRDAGTDEQTWLNTMEKVETAIFEGKRHPKAVDAAIQQQADLHRADRRQNKHTTVMMHGYAINKASLQCADWEAVPTMAGKDPRLAEPVRAKKAKVEHQDHCQHCWQAGDLTRCSGCPRSYHVDCLDEPFQARAQSTWQFYCPQHECVQCGAKTADAGGMIYRCRWCEHGYCEDCLDFDRARLAGDSVPELEMLGLGAVDQAWFIECPACITHWQRHQRDAGRVAQMRRRIDREYQEFLIAGRDTTDVGGDDGRDQVASPSTSASASAGAGAGDHPIEEHANGGAGSLKAPKKPRLA